MEDGERDEAREPEQHRQRVEPEHGNWVREGGEEARRQGEVDEYEECPDGGEDHEAVGGGREAVGRDWDFVSWAPTAEIIGKKWKGKEMGGGTLTMAGESEDYDGEESLHSA